MNVLEHTLFMPDSIFSKYVEVQLLGQGYKLGRGSISSPSFCGAGGGG